MTRLGVCAEAAVVLPIPTSIAWSRLGPAVNAGVCRVLGAAARAALAGIAFASGPIASCHGQTAPREASHLAGTLLAAPQEGRAQLNARQWDAFLLAQIDEAKAQRGRFWQPC